MPRKKGAQTFMESASQSDEQRPAATIPPLKLPKLEIQSTTPWSDDDLEREKVAEALTNMVKVETNPLVATLNGGWGTGKTFFLERWKAHLKIEGIQAIYFNAWEEDYSDNPLVAIVGQLRDELDEDIFRAAVQAVVSATKRIAGRAARNAIKLVTADIVEIEVDDADTDRSKLFDEYDKARDTTKQLENALEKLTAKVYEETNRPLVFIVDELDRCRPTFAIELLERVKHLFGIPNMVFVLGIDRNQLGSSVKSVYGDIDVDGYLRRFFDMEFVLPPADAGDYCLRLIEHHSISLRFQDLRNLAQNDIHTADLKTCKTALPHACRWFKLTLREVEHVIRQLVLAVRNLQAKNRFYPELVAVLLVVRLRNPSIYHGFVRQERNASDVLNYIEDQFDAENLSHDEARVYETFLALFYLLSQTDRSDEHIESEQLHLLAQEKPLTRPERLSRYTVAMNPKQCASFAKHYFHIKNHDFDSTYPNYYTLTYLSGLIDLTSLVSTR